MVEYTIFDFIIDVGAPIAGAIVSGIFIFIIIKKILDDIVGDIDTLRGFTKMLITRVKTMNNDIIRIDSAVSSALGLTPDLDRIARAENFVEDGTIDVRRD
jgi:hypothetical protein|tara:strand:- start:1954 stop:2256 length:303 start_codon:yes stop_codon:yes gene_type:complete